MTDFENELREHGKRVRNHIKPAVDLKNISIPKKKRNLKPVMALIAAAIAIAGAAASTTAFKTWDLRLANFWGADNKSIDDTENAYEIPMVSETVNGVTVTVEQAIFDNDSLYVLYDVTLPEGTQANERYTFENFGIDTGALENEDAIATIKNTVIDYNDKTITFLLRQTGLIKSKTNKTAALYLSNLGYYDSQNPEFHTVAEGDWCLKWKPEWQSAGYSYIPEKPIYFGAESKLESFTVSPFAATVKVRGEAVLGSIKIKLCLKSGETIMYEPSDGKSTNIYNGDLSFVYFPFEHIISLDEIDEIYVNDVKMRKD